MFIFNTLLAKIPKPLVDPLIIRAFTEAMDMAKKEFSYGIIPLRQREGRWEALITLHGKGHWAFPKGHKNPGEESIETATRELREETGLEILRFLPGSPLKEHYFFIRNGEKVDKRVEYYLAEVHGRVVLQAAEISDFLWLSLEEAEAQATFIESKHLCQKVIQLLCKK